MDVLNNFCKSGNITETDFSTIFERKVEDIVIVFLILIFVLWLWISCMFVFRRLLTYLIQKWKDKMEERQRTRKELHFDESFIIYFIFTVVSWIFISVVDTECLSLVFVIIRLQTLSSCFFSLWSFGYDDIDLFRSQSDKNKSIGACWANGAYKAYYEVIFRGWPSMVREYIASGKQLDCTQLVLVCPLSCNVQGELSERSERITLEGSLQDIKYDQGANINRTYKTPVYKVEGRDRAFNLMVQYPSSLGTLFEVRDVMKEEFRRYHRDCFIRSLKELLNFSPCIILEYNDLDPSTREPLDQFLLRNLNLQPRNEDGNSLRRFYQRTIGPIFA